MSDWFGYLLHSSVCIAVLYLVYALFLRKDTFYAINRFFLAGSLIISALIPLVNLSSMFENSPVRYYYVLDTIRITPDEVLTTVNSNPGTFQVLFAVYLTGAILFLLRFAMQLIQLGLITRKYGITRKDGMNLVLLHQEYSPFSFFNLIFINSKHYQPEQLREIIDHERVHIAQQHSVDLILLELMTILQWFNPFIWLYRSSMKEIHEYLADEGVLLKGTGISEYQNMLLNQSLGIQLNDLTNNFNHSLLKRRFIMMTRQKSGFAAMLKPLAALPAILMVMMIFSLNGGNMAAGQDTPPTPAQKPDGKDVPVTPADQDKDSVKHISSNGQEVTDYVIVDQQPEFKGGEEAFIRYIVENIKYPEDAKKKGITGKVYTQFTIDLNGKILDPKVLRGVDPLLDAEALRVVSAMPDWIPGKDANGKAVKVAITVPIQFTLDEKSTPKEIEK